MSSWLWTKRKVYRRVLVLEELEQRIVLDAGGEGTQVCGEPDSGDTPEPGAAGWESQGTSAGGEGAGGPSGDAPDNLLSQTIGGSLDVVLVSTQLDEIDAICDAVLDGLEIVTYDPDFDNLNSISAKLALLVESSGSTIDSLAVIGHGDEGILTLGADEIHFFNVSDYAPGFDALSEVLSEDAQIQLYGCSLAGNVLGEALADRLAMYTGADVFASDDTTGGHACDWDLEYSSSADAKQRTLFDLRKLAAVEDDLGGRMVADLNVGSAGSNPSGLTAMNGGVMFSADDGSGECLFWSDGTSIVRLTDTASRVHAWVELENVDGTLFFYCRDEAHGYELWKTDGTQAGTELVKDIRPGPVDSYMVGDGASGNLMCSVNGTLFFAASTTLQLDAWGNAVPADHWELWMSDGTAAGTVRVLDVTDPSVDGIPRWSEFFGANGMLYFTATDGAHGYELWKCEYDSGAGTWIASMVKDVNPSGDGIVKPGGSGSYSDFEVVGDLLFFTADKGDGLQLWRTDGTDAGTYQLGLFGDAPSGLTAMDDSLYFQGNGYWDIDGDPVPDHVGCELWKTDGSAVVLVKDIAAGSDNSVPDNLTNVNGTLFFSAYDGEHGRELWKTDGTGVGTVLVKDIRPGVESGLPLESWVDFVEVTDTLAFWADDGSGQRLWQSDGTSAGTKASEPYVEWCDFRWCWEHVNPLFYSYNDGIYGTELWVWSPDPLAPLPLNLTAPVFHEYDPLSARAGEAGNLFTTAPLELGTENTDNIPFPSGSVALGPQGNRPDAGLASGLELFGSITDLTYLEAWGIGSISDVYCSLAGFAEAVEAGKVLVFNLDSMSLYDLLQGRHEYDESPTKQRETQDQVEEELWSTVSQCTQRCTKWPDPQALWEDFTKTIPERFRKLFSAPEMWWTPQSSGKRVSPL